MEANILADIQNIKERLFEMGQADVDDTVLHELINSFGPYYDIEVVTKLMAGRLDYDDSGYRENSGAADAQNKELNISKHSSNISIDQLDESGAIEFNDSNDRSIDSRISKKDDKQAVTNSYQLATDTTPFAADASSSTEKVDNETENSSDLALCPVNKSEPVDSDMAELSDSNSESYSYYGSYYDNYLDEDVDESTGNKGINGYSPGQNYSTEKPYPNLDDVYKALSPGHSSPKDTEKYDSSSSSDNEASNWMRTSDFHKFRQSAKQSPSASSSPEHNSFAGSTSTPHVAQRLARVDSTESDEVELLEENNNDPNNNLDSIQFQSENSVEFVDLVANDQDNEIVIVSDGRDSPQPSCSKDFNPEPSRVQNTLNHEARQIRSLLPRFNHGLIYKTLNKYRDMSNRAEHTLRELLFPEKCASHFHKRKSVDDICTSKLKKCYADKTGKTTHKKRSKSKYKQREGKVHEEGVEEMPNILRVKSLVFTVNSSDLPDEGRSSDDVLFTTKVQHTPKLTTVKEDPADVPMKIEDIEASPASAENNENNAENALSNEENNEASLVNVAKNNTVRICADTTVNEIIPEEVDSNKDSAALNQESNERSETPVESNTRKDSKVSNTIEASAIPMDITVDDIANEAVNVDNNGSIESPNVSPNVSVKHGLLKPPKFVHKPASVQPETPIATSANNILAPPKLIYTIKKVDASVACSSSSSCSILTPAKLIYTEKTQVNPVVKTQVTQNINEDKPKVKWIVVKGKASDVQSTSTSNTIELSIPEEQGYNKQTHIHTAKQVSIHSNDESTNSNGNAAIIKTELNNFFQSSGHIQTTNVAAACNSANARIELHTQSISNISTQGPSTSGSSSNTARSSKVHSPPEMRQARETLIRNYKAKLEKRKSLQQTTDDSALLKNYYYILSMFPDVDPEYIKEQCRKFARSSGVESLSENGRLNELVEHLLNTGWEHPRPQPSAIENEDNGHYDVNEWYLDLLAIFPNADPNYLRQKAEELYHDPESRKNFVQSNIDNPNYPTREEYMAKKKITKQQKQYTANFCVVKFLELCPDPFSRFERSDRQCTFQKDGFEFLKYRFNRTRMDTLRKVYRKNQHNLSLTAKELEEMNSNMKTKRLVPQFLATEDIPLLQEMAFIAHKTELREHLNELKKKEENEFKSLKARNELLQCQCCFDNEVMPSKCVTCDDGHVFCHQCLQRGVDAKLGDGETHIPCFSNCGSEFSLSVLQSVLTPTKFSILLQKRQQAEVIAAGLEGLVSCPFCHFASIPPPEDKVFKCLNPECLKESCRLCKELNHVPLKCDEANSENLRHILEEKMTEALVRTCYKCKKPFFKDEGCNRMVCVCGAVMCYICDKPIIGYDHFSGQGSDRKDLCPLWSDNNRINAQTVAIAAAETVRELKKANPAAQIDVAPLVPQVPSSSKGPHELVPHSDIIPKRAFTVSKKK